MARLFSQTLIRGSEALIRAPSAAAAPASLVGLRRRSSLSDRVELIEVEVGAEAEAEAEAEAGEVEVFGMRRLEDAIHAIVVRRSAPDWLPFVPGASYWVPPRRRPSGIVELVSRLANPMTEEETLSFTTVRGWPSSVYFVEGRPPHPVKRRSKKASAQTDDEES